MELFWKPQILASEKKTYGPIKIRLWFKYKNLLSCSFVWVNMLSSSFRDMKLVLKMLIDQYYWDLVGLRLNYLWTPTRERFVVPHSHMCCYPRTQTGFSSSVLFWIFSVIEKIKTKKQKSSNSSLSGCVFLT